MPNQRIEAEFELDGHGAINENGVTTMFLGGQYVRAPLGIPGIAPGTKLKVLSQFVSDAACPYGEGKLCLRVEGGLLAVFTCTDKGIAWLRGPI
jgi:hypothetical protein